MRYRVECLDRHGGKPYVAEFEASSPEAAVRIAEMAGHQAVRTLGAPARPAPVPAAGEVRTIAPQSPAAPGDAKANASLALGALSLLAWCLPLVGFPIALIGLALGLASQARTSSIRTAGIVTSSIGLALAIGNAVAGVFMVMNGAKFFGAP